MELILQDETSPGVVLDALISLADQRIDQLRIAVAYTTLGGSELLMPQWRQRVGDVAWQALPKVLITSVDFGLTDPAALALWAQQPNTRVRLANAHLLAGGHLRPAEAFHPKLYLLDHAGSQSCVMGSANLSRRALTINTESVARARGVPELMRQADWDHLEAATTPLDDQLLGQYEALRPQPPAFQADEPPAPVALAPAAIPAFPDEVDAGRLDPAAFDRFWLEAGSMTTGGSRNILEVPRHANRFFGFNFNNYADQHIVIGHPVLTLGPRRWNDRQLAWHGAPQMNKMERLTLPTAAQGGPLYPNTAVLFRRHGQEFELEVADWDSAIAVAWRNASVGHGHIFRLGGRGPRVCGLL
ncbi:MAG: phospholipase D family protein [Phycisphaeraceae bacterium]|nr:phospholipase D family protein [Phycisphaeraceae bacterium]